MSFGSQLWVSRFTGWTQGHRGRKCSPLTQRYLRSHIPGIPEQLHRAGRSHLCALPSLCSPFRWSHTALRPLSVLSNSWGHPDPFKVSKSLPSPRDRGAARSCQPLPPSSLQQSQLQHVRDSSKGHWSQGTPFLWTSVGLGPGSYSPLTSQRLPEVISSNFLLPVEAKWW